MTASLRAQYGLLHHLPRHLEPALTDAGFVLSDADPLSTDLDGDDVRQLEYRARIRGQLMLLGFYGALGERAITAELWTPEHLRQELPSLSVTSVALRHLTWLRNPETDSEALIRSIAAEIAIWITEVIATPAQSMI